MTQPGFGIASGRRCYLRRGVYREEPILNYPPNNPSFPPPAPSNLDFRMLESRPSSTEGALLSTTCTTGWSDWFHGEFWLLPNGLARIPIGVLKSLLCVGYVRNVLTPQPHFFSIADWERAQRRPDARWIPGNALAEAELSHTSGADQLRATLIDGTRIQLLWIPNPTTYALLDSAISAWIDPRGRQDVTALIHTLDISAW